MLVLYYDIIIPKYLRLRAYITLTAHLRCNWARKQLNALLYKKYFQLFFMKFILLKRLVARQ